MFCVWRASHGMHGDGGGGGLFPRCDVLVILEKDFFFSAGAGW